MRSDLITPDVKVRSYKGPPELSLLDPFETVGLDMLKNKMDNVEVANQPPTLIPAQILGLPMAEDEFDHSGGQWLDCLCPRRVSLPKPNLVW